jgi:hypothetical protein
MPCYCHILPKEKISMVRLSPTIILETDIIKVLKDNEFIDDNFFSCACWYSPIIKATSNDSNGY